MAAASIMVFVLAPFVFGDSRTIKLMGLGMASAVLLEASLIRMLVVPEVMHRIGPANWWLPRWLDRALPQLIVEGSKVEHPVPPGGTERFASGGGDVTDEDEDEDERGHRGVVNNRHSPGGRCLRVSAPWWDPNDTRTERRRSTPNPLAA